MPRRPQKAVPHTELTADEERFTVEAHQALVIAEILRSTGRWAQIEAAIAPLVEDLQLGIAGSAREAIQSDAAGDAFTVLGGGGSNQPPEPIKPEVLREMLVEQYQPLIDRQAELLAAAARFHKAHETIKDETIQGRAAEFVSQIQSAIKKEEAAHADEKRPWLDLGATVQAFFANLWDPLKKQKTLIETKQLAFARDLAAKARQAATDEAAARQKEAEEAARLAAEQMTPDALDAAAQAAEAAVVASQEATAKPADLSRVRGDYGAVASLRIRWKIRPAQDWRVNLHRDYLMPDQSALDVALKNAPRLADGTPDLKLIGAEIYADASIGNRR